MVCVGLGIGLQYHVQFEERTVSEHSASLLCRLVIVMLAVAIAQASHLIQISSHLHILLFYVLVAGKIGIVIFLVVLVGFLTGANNHSNTKHQ